MIKFSTGIFFFSIIFFNTSCQNNNTQNKENQKVLGLEKLLVNSSVSTDKELKTFLGYNFGMSQKEFNKNSDSISKTKKSIFKKKDGVYYNFSTKKLNFNGKILPEFFENKLIGVGIICTEEKNTEGKVVETEIVNFLNDIYGKYTIKSKYSKNPNDYLNPDVFNWIKNDWHLSYYQVQNLNLISFKVISAKQQQDKVIANKTKAAKEKLSKAHSQKEQNSKKDFN